MALNTMYVEKDHEVAGVHSFPRVLIGEPPNHWLHSPHPPTFDLTRPQAPDFLVPDRGSSVRVETTTSQILISPSQTVISPSQTALVIIDMQNFFLSTALDRDPDGPGSRAKDTLLSTAIPAARKAAVQVIWLNWGLTDADLNTMPPSVRRSFGFEVSQGALGRSAGLPENPGDQGLTEIGKPKRLYRGLGNDLGPIELGNGKVVDGGRLLFADTWNADLPPDLRSEFEHGQNVTPPDIWLRKDRMSGLWGASTPATEFLEKSGIRTLLFAGVNTDQCVGGSLTDAFSRGYDCILLKDACGTTSPDFASDSWEYNSARAYGFVAESKSFAEGVQSMLDARRHG